MRTVVFRDINGVCLEDVAGPRLQRPTDAIARLTASTICDIDLHFVRNSIGGIRPGTILGHKSVDIIKALGDEVRSLQIGDWVVIPSTIACDNYVYCRAGCCAQCDVANPNGSQAGTVFFGGSRTSGGFHRLQAEKARIPCANIGLIRLPSSISDGQAILLSGILPVSYFGTKLAGIAPGSITTVFGYGPVGQFAIANTLLLGVARVLAINRHPGHLYMARQQSAGVTDFERGDPVQAPRRLTAEIGIDHAIDVVGVDAEHNHGTAAPAPRQEDISWDPGNAPAQALGWAMQSLVKAGILLIIGVYVEDSRQFPIGLAMSRDLTIHMDNYRHREYTPLLFEHALSRYIDPAKVLIQVEPIDNAIEAFEAFDHCGTDWIEVEPIP